MKYCGAASLLSKQDNEGKRTEVKVFPRYEKGWERKGLAVIIYNLEKEPTNRACEEERGGRTRAPVQGQKRGKRQDAEGRLPKRRKGGAGERNWRIRLALLII